MALPKPYGNVRWVAPNLSRPMNLLLLALVPACFALNPVTGRALADVFGPAGLSVVRWLLSALIIAGLALSRGREERWRAPPVQVLRIAFLGAMAMGFCAYAAFMAARTTEATTIALIYGCASAFVTAWEVAAGRQRLTGVLLLGVAACLLGVVVVLTRGHPPVLLSLRFAAGNLWAAAGMGVFVAYTIAMRRTPATLTPLAQFTVMALAATVALLPFAWLEIVQGGPPRPDTRALIWLIVAVLATGIGALLGYNASLRRNGPVLTSASLTLTPMYAAAMAIALIGETLAWYHAVAVALVVAGLMLINRDQAHR
jgi:drug/metabolite transporter (DMT)-like permease